MILKSLKRIKHHSPGNIGLGNEPLRLFAQIVLRHDPVILRFG